MVPGHFLARPSKCMAEGVAGRETPTWTLTWAFVSTLSGRCLTGDAARRLAVVFSACDRRTLWTALGELLKPRHLGRVSSLEPPPALLKAQGAQSSSRPRQDVERDEGDGRSGLARQRAKSGSKASLSPTVATISPSSTQLLGNSCLAAGPRSGK